ncbi:30S ribosomal protein S13 [Candidatus Woesearchaeota archaeon]|jgi:small subunit ribosomal protein S13|nr:30S ribosomal protein S13 [Candidatus Woesearchaeota archaeon]
MAEEKKQDPGFKHIVRIANVDLPGQKPIRVALKKIKGVGFSLAHMACILAGIDKTAKTGELNDAAISRLDGVVKDPVKSGVPTWALNRRKDYESGDDTHLTMGNLDFTKDNDIKRLKKIKAYRGVRHSLNRPVRGQKTRSNFRKSKGKVVGVKKKGKK